MVLYDLISEIAQKQCDKLYEVKISIGKTDLDNKKLLINEMEIELEDVVFSDCVCEKLQSGDLNVVCLHTQNCIFVIDKLGEIL